jgi:hypothetical protein
LARRAFQLLALDPDTQLVHAVAQDAAGGAKQFSGTRLYPIALIKRFNYYAPLKVSDHLIEFDG